MTIQKYRNIDIAILTGLAIIVDLIAYWLLGAAGELGWYNFYLTPSIVLIIIIYIRWGWVGLLPNLIIALLHLFVYQDELLVHYNRWIPYLVSFMTLFISILWKNIIRSDIIKNRLIMVTLYIGLGFTVLITSELMIALSLGNKISLEILIVRHLVNILIVFGAFLIATFQKGLVVDAKSYLIKMKNEEKEARDG